MDWKQTVGETERRALGNVLSYQDFLIIERCLMSDTSHEVDDVLSKVSQAITTFEKERTSLLRIAVQERIS